MRFKHHLFASSFMLAAALGTSVYAQSKPATSAAAAATTIEELVVTAEKREQSLQDVPVAVSAFSGATRDLKGINSIQDMTNFTPGFIYSSANDRSSMRGIGRLSNVKSTDSAVAIYIDGVYTTSTVLAGGPPLQVDRVEVLRGPQGTLYGRNSIGGTVNIISKRPTEDFYAEVRGVVQNFGYTSLQAAFSGPLADNLQFRISGYKTDQREGYFSNINSTGTTEGSKKNEYNVELQLQAQLGEHAEWWGKLYALHWDNIGGPGARDGYIAGRYDKGIVAQSSVVVYNPAYGLGPGIVPGSLTQTGGVTSTTNPSASDIRSFSSDQHQQVRLDQTFGLTTNFVYHMPSFDIKYIGGLTGYRYRLTGDAEDANSDTSVSSYQIALQPGSICGTIQGLFLAGRAPQGCTPYTVNSLNTYYYEERPKWGSSEINLTSTGDGPLQWIVGAFYYNETYTNPFNAYTNQPQYKTPLLGAAPNPTGAYSLTGYDMTTNSKAVFGQIDWKATDTVKITAGLRYTKDHKYGFETRRVIGASDAIYALVYPSLGLSGFGPGTAANWGSLLGNINAVASLGPFLGVPALAGLAGLGNGAFDLASSIAPTTTAAGAKGVSDPVKCNAAGVCTQYTINSAGELVRNLNDTSNAVTGTLGAQWQPDSDTLAYARYSRGYKAFGFSAGGLLAVPEAAAEHADSYEVGLKKTIGNTLVIDLAAFHISYLDFQAPVSVRVAGVKVTQFINVPKAVSYGLEADVIWAPIDNLTLTLDYSYNPTEITKSNLYVDTNDNINTAAISVKGNKLPQAPEQKIAFNASYTWILDAGKFNANASYIWRDKEYANIFTRDYNAHPSWDQIDLRASFVPTSGNYTIIGYVKNVGDTVGYNAAFNGIERNLSEGFNTGVNVYSLTPPRTYGLEVQYRF